MAFTKKPVPSDELSTFGARLRHEREQQRLSRPALAELMNGTMSARIIEHLENGTTEVKLQQIGLVAEALGVSEDWLIKGESQDGDTKPGVIFDSSSKAENCDTLVSDLDEVSEGSKYLLLFKHRLAELDELREGDFALHQRKLPQLVEDTMSAAGYLELPEIFLIAEERGLFDVEVQSAEAEAADYEGMDDSTPELLDRIIDTAIFGLDLYHVEMSTLAAFAERHSISSPHFFGGWDHQAEIVPRVREKYRERALRGEVSLTSSLTVA